MNINTRAHLLPCLTGYLVLEVKDTPSVFRTREDYLRKTPNKEACRETPPSPPGAGLLPNALQEAAVLLREFFGRCFKCISMLKRAFLTRATKS